MEKNKKRYAKLLRQIRPVLVRRFVNVNRLDKPWIIKRFHRLMERMARKINAHKDKVCNVSNFQK